tara:strand:- start:89 stop:259 length:171 start_codon:yes stop_codon:yes gene_type:complete
VLVAIAKQVYYYDVASMIEIPSLDIFQYVFEVSLFYPPESSPPGNTTLSPPNAVLY